MPQDDEALFDRNHDDGRGSMIHGVPADGSINVAPQGTRRALLLRCFQWLAALVILVWLGWNQRGAIREISRVHVNVALFFAAVACSLLAQLAMGLRWYCLMPLRTRTVRITDACRATFLGALSNYSPLGDYGGMAFRVAFLVRCGRVVAADAVLSVLMDRALGLGCLVVMCWGAITLLQVGSRHEIAAALQICNWAFLAGVFGIGVICATSHLPGLRHRRLFHRLRRFIADSPTWLLSQRRQVALAVGLSLVSQAFSVLALTCITGSIAAAEDPTPTLIQNAAILPVVEVSAVILPTPAGIGVREFTLTQLYRQALQDVSADISSRLGFLAAIGLRLAVFLSTVLGLLASTIASRCRVRSSDVHSSTVDPQRFALRMPPARSSRDDDLA